MRASVPLRLVSAGASGAGSGSALDQAFRAHAAQVATVALRILGRHDEADDLVQDVFVKANKWLPQLREPTALRAWLMKVTVRLAWRRLRTRRWRVALGLDGSYDYSQAAGHRRVSPEDAAFMAEVYRILDRLPAAERLAWSLRHVDGERLEDVAQHCGCSLATAKRWIAAVQARIQREIDHV
ncbi:MAG TPA: sigma-70 family RNA polymerase sigma factor [Polyangia bacterium]|jgi:RNA polymerase sigma factor, sigma-70 family|nr:sigma-70 family RNA polymerase sigma factor [Polyangia bacterium]